MRFEHLLRFSLDILNCVKTTSLQSEFYFTLTRSRTPGRIAEGAQNSHARRLPWMLGKSRKKRRDKEGYFEGDRCKPGVRVQDNRSECITIANDVDKRFDRMIASPRSRMSFPSKADRERCWSRRDEYWKCLDEGKSPEGCIEFRKQYEKFCPSQWVSITYGVLSAKLPRQSTLYVCALGV